MTAHHPCLMIHPEKVRAKLDAVTMEASFLYFQCSLWMADSGMNGHMPSSRLVAATSRRMTAKKCTAAAQELVTEKLWGEESTTGTFEDMFWEQPDVDVWTDDVKRARWQRGRALLRNRDLCRRIQDRDRHLCRYCGVRVNWNDKRSAIAATYDHIDPDGPNTFANVVIACKNCNEVLKHGMTLDQAGMSLLRPGTDARAVAASAGQSRSPEPRARAGDLVPIQIGTESEPDQGQVRRRAPARLRTEPNPNQIRSESIQPGKGPGAGVGGDYVDV